MLLSRVSLFSTRKPGQVPGTGPPDGGPVLRAVFADSDLQQQTWLLWGPDLLGVTWFLLL